MFDWDVSKSFNCNNIRGWHIRKKNCLNLSSFLYVLHTHPITFPPFDHPKNTELFEMTVGVLTTATSFSRCNPTWFLSMGLRQWSGLCSSSSRKYPGTEGTNQKRHCNHHRWHATNSVDKKNQLGVTFCILYFSSNSCSTCFGQPYAHHQELTTAWCYGLVLVCVVAAGRWSSPVGR